MTDVYSLLSLPTTSQAFKSLRSTAVDLGNDGSASPPRKVARLDTDSDSASASRSKNNRDNKFTGPIQIRVITGDYDSLKSQTNAADQGAQTTLIRRSVNVLLSKDPNDVLPATCADIYAACRLCVTVYEGGAELYERVKMSLEQRITRFAMFLLDSKDTADDVDWLGFFAKNCEWFENQVSLLQSLLTYLDQVYVADHSSTSMPIRELAYGLFGERVFGNPHIGERLRSGVSTWLDWERQHRLVHDGRDHIRELIKYLISHKQYAAFEEHYVDITQFYYLKESKEEAEATKDDPRRFFKHVQQRIVEECDRSKSVLPIGTWTVAREVTEQSLLNGRIEWLSNATVGPYIEWEDVTSLADMYTLFARVDGLKSLCNAFRDYTKVVVEKIVKDAARDEEMVQRLLDLKVICDNTLSSAFVDEIPELPSTGNNGSTSTRPPVKKANQDFIYALNDAFTIGFKARRNKPAEMIAKHLDKLMRKGQGAMSDAGFEKLLDSALALYRFTEDKDVFRTFYHRSLAKRLLLEKSASNDFEAGMLKKLKEQYDPDFGMGEDMFKDLALSKEAMLDYHKRLPKDSSGRKLNVMVLQRSAWPFTVQKKKIDLPPNMQGELTHFTEFYKVKHSGHVLDWDHALGTATLGARFKAEAKELSVSLYQAIVLLLFNDEEEIPFKDIRERTRMEDGELRRTLQSLACGKKKVLKKIPPGRDVDDSDVFRFNADFEDPRARFHINSIQVKVTAEESRRTNISIEDDRKHYIDAAIVRIMKAKREMTYEQLKAATVDAVKSHFVPAVDTIKKRVDSLVENDYLERSVEDKNRFLYVA